MKRKYYVADFETTVYQGQKETEVWASALVDVDFDPLFPNVTINNTISGFFADVQEICKDKSIVYFHNLKFDGQFILSALISAGYVPAFSYEVDNTVKESSIKEMYPKTYTCLISEGAFYQICVCFENGKIIKFRDSFKLIPLSVKAIGPSFDTQHRKLEIEYEGLRHAGDEITPEEKSYIENDVLVVAEALQYMFKLGHNSMTIGGCCMKDFKMGLIIKAFADEEGKLNDFWKNPKNQNEYIGKIFPSLQGNCPISSNESMDEFIRKSYHGGWCYCDPRTQGKVLNTTGTVADVNSLYPSVMHSVSGSEYPYGTPTWFNGEIPPIAKNPGFFYVVRFSCRFNIKPEHLPFIQIKGSPLYKANEMLKTSDIFKDGKYFKNSICYTSDGQKIVKPVRVTLTMTKPDFELFNEFYEIEDVNFIGGCWFAAKAGLFDDYINKYMKIKAESTISGNKGMRTVSKMFLNNLYGRFSMRQRDSKTYPIMSEDGILDYHEYSELDPDESFSYIAIGSAVTAYARAFTIRAAQANYEHFAYSDTDSIHCFCKPEEMKGVKVHETDLCCWKLEKCFDSAIFVRQKTYIEHVTHEDLEKVEPFYNMTACGCPQRCKDLFIYTIAKTEENLKKLKKLNDEEREYIKKNHTLEDFDIGLTIPSKLMQKRIKGGVILVNTNFTLNDFSFFR